MASSFARTRNSISRIRHLLFFPAHLCPLRPSPLPFASSLGLGLCPLHSSLLSSQLGIGSHFCYQSLHFYSISPRPIGFSAGDSRESQGGHRYSRPRRCLRRAPPKRGQLRKAKSRSMPYPRQSLRLLLQIHLGFRSGPRGIHCLLLLPHSRHTISQLLPPPLPFSPLPPTFCPRSLP
ncbi:hypothetical protein KSP40_PGU016522 [Platanthera guangdongensis]|uniref:Uncharacterized protein n=1 Tax=Platanthera guangdongensis TaxID=2320717 RepID=A0ABR2LQB4_9ASPA